MLVKSKTAKSLISVSVIILILGITFAAGFWSSCGIDHVKILSELEQYEHLEPESCETLLFEILEFNEECEPKIEIIDCG